MDSEKKAKLARKLTGALHQAPDNPELFTNILIQMLASNGLHLTELAVTIGDTTSRLVEQLQTARRNAPPTFDNLVDLAGTKIILGRVPERALAKALHVTVNVVQEYKKSCRVPRAWFDKVHALPDLKDTQTQLDPEIKHVVCLLARSGYAPKKIHSAFEQIRSTRTGFKQILIALYGNQGMLAADELGRMQEELFGGRSEPDRRFKIWLETQLRAKAVVVDHPALGLSPKQVERLRNRFVREVMLRRDSPAYQTVAAAAELIERPVRANPRGRHAVASRDARELQSRLGRILGGEGDERLAMRLAQLTGLDDRHASDLLKGANGIGEVWWKFLDMVEAKLPGGGAYPLTQPVERHGASNGVDGVAMAQALGAAVRPGGDAGPSPSPPSPDAKRSSCGSAPKRPPLPNGTQSLSL